MADSQETEEVVDGYDFEEGSGSGTGGGTITINSSVVIDTGDFDVNYALAGGVLYAIRKLQPGETSPKSFIATEFKRNADNRYFPYTAKVEGKTHQFDVNGKTSQGLYALCTTSAKIQGPGATPGEGHEGQNKDDEDITVYMDKLTLREQVASDALNAMIGHIPDPLSYPATNIKLLVKKAFEFAIEFMDQAFEYRKSNATKNSNSEIVPDASPTEMALANIADMITELKSAFINGEGSTPVTMIDKLSELTEATDEIKQALIYSDGSNDPIGIAEVVHDGDASIASALGTTNTRLGSIITGIGTTNDTLGDIETGTFTRLDTANGKLNEIDSNTENISVTATLDDSGIISAIQHADNYDVLVDIRSNTNPNGSILEKVTSIDNKMN